MFHAAVTCVTVSRAVPRHVQCEHCGAEFVYNLERAGRGEAGYGLLTDQETVNQRAFEAACVDLAKEIDTGVEAVPCPACFKYQAHMAEAARQIQWGWVRGLGGQALLYLPFAVVGAILVAVVAFPKDTDTAITIAASLAGVLLLAGLITLLVFRFSPCDPNRWSESYRKAQADSLAIPRADFNIVLRDGGPYVADLTTGMEEQYAGVTFLWVLPEEIEADATVPLTLDDREMQVELSDADDDGVFLGADRIRNGPDGLRICLRVFSVYRPRAETAEPDAE